MMINNIMCASKILTDLCFTKGKIKTKNGSVKVVYNVLVMNMSWKNIKMICLSINDKPSAKVEEGTIEFEIISNKYQFHLKIMLILGVI